eukprot:jgi/Psemu1/3817/gm1.3817_g
MGTKSDSPKLTPAERLARKRAAARLRQQRCRARKRQAMLEKKRGETDVQVGNKVKVNESPRPGMVMHSLHHRPQSRYPTYKPVHLAESLGESWVGVRAELPHRPQRHKFPSEPIYNCVSFDSQKSLDEAHTNMSRASATPPASPSERKTPVITPNRTPPPSNKLVRVLSDEKLEEPLVPEEEAAVAAMLSLKSGSTTKTDEVEDENKKTPASPPNKVMISHESKKFTPTGMSGIRSHPKSQNHSPHSHRIHHQPPRRMNPHHYEAFSYGPPMKIPLPPHILHAPPGYYRVHPPVPPPHPHYHRGYYPPAHRYVSYYK